MPASKASILIVENDAIIAEDIACRLRHLGYTVCGSIDSGEKVPRAVFNHTPDLVLMDLELAGNMDGVDAMASLRARRDIPVIFLTGLSDEDIRKRALHANPLTIIFKPVETKQLALHIEIALQTHAVKTRLQESLALLESTIESTADGLLVVDCDGRVLLHNRQFIKIWGIPPELEGSKSDKELLNFVLPKLVDPDEFVLRVQSLYRTPERESMDILLLKSGTTIERFSRPYYLGDEIQGRVWSFRDTTEKTRALKLFNDRLELLVTRRTADLEATNAELRREVTLRKSLEREILSISEKQQQRLGRDLHDGICQELAGINFSLEATAKRMSPRSPALHRLHTIAENVRTAMLHTRLLSRGLAPAALESGNLASAMAELAANTGTLCGVSCPFHCEGSGLDEVDRELAIHLYRVAQESLQNAVKHASASKITITLRQLDKSIRLCIEDNGNGLPATHDPTESQGMGLEIMHHRASVLGGRLVISSVPGSGVRVECSIPV